MKKLKLRQDPQLEVYLAAMQSVLFKGINAYSTAVNWTEAYEDKWYLKKLITQTITKLDRDHLLRYLEWNIHIGRRQLFEKHRAYLFALTDEAREQYIQSCAGDPYLYHEVQIVNRYAPSLPKGHITAVDLAWAVYIAKGGYYLDMISEEEYWSYIDLSVAMNKASYSSWAEYLTGSVAGSYFTNNGQLINSYQASMEQTLFQRLLNGHYSPMTRVDIQGRAL